MDDFIGFEDAESLKARATRNFGEAQDDFPKVDTRNKIKLREKEELDLDNIEFDDIQTNEELTLQVKYLHNVEKELDESSSRIKKLGKLKRELRKRIATFMNANKVEELNLKKERVKYTVSKRMATVNPLTVKRLPIGLSLYFMENENMTSDGAKEKTDAMIKFIRSKADKVEQIRLRKHK